MLAEKFFLLLETIRSHTYDDGAPASQAHPDTSQLT